MDLIGCINDANTTVEALRSVVTSFESTIKLVTAAWSESIGTIWKLDASMLDLNARIKELTPDIPKAKKLMHVNAKEQTGNKIVKELTEKTVKNENYLASDALSDKQILKTLDEIHSLADHAQKVSGAFSELSPTVKSFSVTLGIIKDISESVGGFTKLASSANNGSTTYEAITSAAEVLGGAASIGEATASFGPVGGIIAGGILITGETLAVIAQEKENRKKLQTEALHTEKNLQTFVMPEQDAEKYLEYIHTLAKHEQHPWKTSSFPVRDNIKQYGKEAYDLNIPIPYARTDHLYVRPNLMNDRVHADEGKLSIKRSYLEQTFDLQQRLKYAGMTEGRIGFDELAVHAIMDAKTFDKKHHTYIAGRTESAIKESLTYLLHNANEGTMVLDDHLKTKERRRSGGVYEKTSGGKMITINLNRPMIENFTINTRGGQEGLNDFKRKVEEVLLEILNSANATQ